MSIDDKENNRQEVNNSPNSLVSGRDVYVTNNYNYPSQSKLIKRQLLLQRIIEKIANLTSDDEINMNNVEMPYDISDKIEYNNIIVYRQLLEENIIYYDSCNDILNALTDEKGDNCKTRVLRDFKNKYQERIGELIKENGENSRINFIRTNSDLIIKEIINLITAKINESVTAADILYQEDVDFGVTTFVCYCFYECKILENPNIQVRS